MRIADRIRRERKCRICDDSSVRKTNKPKCTLVIILTIVHLGLLSPLKSVIWDFTY